MKKNIKFHVLLVFIASLLMFSSCEDKFLDVSDPLVLSEGIFPQEVSDLEPIMVDIYGRLQETYYGTYMRMWPLMSHNRDHGYNGAQYPEFALIEFNPNLSNVNNVWTRHFLAIGKCNDMLAAVDRLRDKDGLTASQMDKLDEYEGQALFMRAFNYFYLINLYGESPILTEADKSKMGVPLWDYAPDIINETYKARATQGEVWDLIINDLKSAETLLDGVVFPEKARVNEWAVKSFLGKAYIFTLQWDKARDVLKDVIDNSGKQLVSYDILRNSFNGQNKFNAESIFEVNSTYDPLGGSSQFKTGADWMKGISISYVDQDGTEVCNGFGNMFIHDMTMPRYGFNSPATTTAEQKDPAYLAYSLQVRADKSVDPRLYVTTFQPYVDSINYIGNWRKIAKGRVESYNAEASKAWCIHKYTVIDRYWGDLNGWHGINMIVMRLADVYLLYAEAQMRLNQTGEALEYINKVHRRAYDVPVNTPSSYDYGSLADRTKTLDPADPLANDPLKYERWAEFGGEGVWWFDVRRFDLGQEEATYYQRVKGGALEWRDTKYAMPISTTEMNANSQMIQNPGY